MSKPLPPLPDEAFEHGYQEQTKIDMQKHKHEAKVISGTELRCIKCGAGWMGTDILILKKLLESV